MPRHHNAMLMAAWQRSPTSQALRASAKQSRSGGGTTLTLPTRAGQLRALWSRRGPLAEPLGRR